MAARVQKVLEAGLPSVRGAVASAATAEVLSLRPVRTQDAHGFAAEELRRLATPETPACCPVHLEHDAVLLILLPLPLECLEVGSDVILGGRVLPVAPFVFPGQ